MTDDALPSAEEAAGPDDALRVDPDELRKVAAGLPGRDGISVPIAEAGGLPGEGWASRPAVTALLAGLRCRLEDLAGGAERLAAGLREAAGAYDDADRRAEGRAERAWERTRR